MQNYATLVSLFDKHRFALCFDAFLARHRLRGTHFAELSEIPQYKVSRILCELVKEFDNDHSKICKYMQMSEKAFFLGDEDELASAIERFCSVGRERAQGMARIVADIASLPEDENKDVAEAIAELRGASERPE